MSNTAQIEAWIAKNGVSPPVKRRYRRYLGSERHPWRITQLHECDEDGRPKCQCGKKAMKAGHLGEMFETEKREANACGSREMHQFVKGCE